MLSPHMKDTAKVNKIPSEIKPIIIAPIIAELIMRMILYVVSFSIKKTSCESLHAFFALMKPIRLTINTINTAIKNTMNFIIFKLLSYIKSGYTE